VHETCFHVTGFGLAVYGFGLHKTKIAPCNQVVRGIIGACDG
jgi:hypothetical protein